MQRLNWFTRGCFHSAHALHHDKNASGQTCRKRQLPRWNGPLSFHILTPRKIQTHTVIRATAALNRQQMSSFSELIKQGWCTKVDVEQDDFIMFKYLPLHVTELFWLNVLALQLGNWFCFQIHHAWKRLLVDDPSLEWVGRFMSLHSSKNLKPAFCEVKTEDFTAASVMKNAVRCSRCFVRI